MTLDSFKHVLNDPRITEIIIVDDCSEWSIYEKLRNKLTSIAKVKLFSNETNLGMSRNKARSVELASNEWCIIFDSDNVIHPSYLDALKKLPNLNRHIIYMPDHAQPHFNYKHFRSEHITACNVAQISTRRDFDCLINTCNYLVNREEYLKAFEYNPEMKGTDTAWYNYLWLKAGNGFYVVPGMNYIHKVHDGSGWKADAEYNLQKGDEIKKLILKLK